MRINARQSVRRFQLSGMSLMELMISVAIGAIVFAAIGSLSMFTARSFVAIGNYGDLDRISRNALDQMSREIRQTRGLTAYSTNKLTFTDYDNSTLIFEYTPSKGTLERKKGTSTTTLLQQCDLLAFHISQRNPSNNFSFYPSTNVATAKLIDVSWRCSRKILGKKVNTESVQTAKIVLRN